MHSAHIVKTGEEDELLLDPELLQNTLKRINERRL